MKILVAEHGIPDCLPVSDMGPQGCGWAILSTSLVLQATMACHPSPKPTQLCRYKVHTLDLLIKVAVVSCFVLVPN